MPRPSRKRPGHCTGQGRLALGRRDFLQAAAGMAGLTALGAAPPAPRASSKDLGIPGPFPGRVVEVRHPG